LQGAVEVGDLGRRQRAAEAAGRQLPAAEVAVADRRISEEGRFELAIASDAWTDRAQRSRAVIGGDVGAAGPRADEQGVAVPGSVKVVVVASFGPRPARTFVARGFNRIWVVPETWPASNQTVLLELVRE
jgi:hypothetical protein